MTTSAQAQVITPNPGPQTIFATTSADIAIIGGAAGVGKSFILTTEPLYHLHNPNAGAVMFRRTSPEITNEGGLWDEANRIYPQFGGVAKQHVLRYQFPSGFKVSYRHLQYESSLAQWQSSQIPLLIIDEVTHFTSKQFFYMLTRNRSAIAGFQPYCRAACNPDPDSFVYKLVEWYLLESGYPDFEKSGVIRWFVRIDGDELLWYDDYDSAIIDCEKRGFDREKIKPKSFTFIPGNVYDNPQLLANNPDYLANLLAQDLVTRERLLGGNWKIRPTAGKVFNRAWFEIVSAFPAGGFLVRFWDLASTEKKQKYKDPDFTASALVLFVGGRSYILDVTWYQAAPPVIDTMMRNLAIQDRQLAATYGSEYAIRWEEEGGATGPRESIRLATLLQGFNCRGVRPSGDKLTRAKAWAAQAYHGNVKMLQGAWNDYVLHHLHNQPDLPHDDIMDAISGAHNEIYSNPGFAISIPDKKSAYNSYVQMTQHAQSQAPTVQPGPAARGAMSQAEIMRRLAAEKALQDRNNRR